MVGYAVRNSPYCYIIAVRPKPYNAGKKDVLWL